MTKEKAIEVMYALLQNTVLNWEKQHGIQQTESGLTDLVTEYQNFCIQRWTPREMLEFDKKKVCTATAILTRRYAVDSFSDKLGLFHQDF